MQWPFKGHFPHNTGNIFFFLKWAINRAKMRKKDEECNSERM